MSGDPFAVDIATLDARTRLNTRLNTVVNHYADREDLLLHCEWGPQEPGDPPAWYSPTKGTVTVNATTALQGADPATVNPLIGEGRRAHPVIVGLMAHAAAHARATDYGPAAVERRVRVAEESEALAAVMSMLEEPRVERRHLMVRPQDRRYLRAQSLLMAAERFELDAGAPVEADRWEAAMVASLVCGRIEAGSLAPFDGDAVLPVVEETLGASTVVELREIVARAVVLEDGDVAGLEGCAREWVSVVGPAPSAGLGGLQGALSGCGGDVGALGGGEGSSGDSGAAGGVSAGAWGDWGDLEAVLGGDRDAGASAGEGVSGGAPAPSEGAVDDTPNPHPSTPQLSPLGHALQQARAALSDDIANDIALSGDEADAQAAAKTRAKERTAAARKAAKRKSKADSVFRPKDGVRKESRGRPAEPWERALAVEMAEAFRKAQFRERARVKSREPVPPGRLDGREAMLGVAQREQGMLVTARPFGVKRSRFTEDPPVSVGLVMDGSGSMDWAAAAIPSMAWALAHAMRRVQLGQAASVVFGKGVQALLGPGEAPERVPEYDASAASHPFVAAVDALEGALGLVSGRGARLLIVVSDGCYREKERLGAVRSVWEMRAAGGRVLWVGPAGVTVFPPGVVEVPVDLVAVKKAAHRVLLEERAGGVRPGVGELQAAGARAVAQSVAEVATEQLCEMLRAIRA